MTDKTPTAEEAWISKQFEDIDKEIARLSVICRLDLLDRANIERVIRNDASVCGAQNPLAFSKLRDLLLMHYATRTRAAAQIGEVETQAIINSVVAKIIERFGSVGGAVR
ncbi:MAG: hypothetical protein U1F64_03580 [Burkholderiales bacterium]